MSPLALALLIGYVLAGLYTEHIIMSKPRPFSNKLTRWELIFARVFFFLFGPIVLFWVMLILAFVQNKENA